MPDRKEDNEMKLAETISFRLPKHTKNLYEKLPIEAKHETQHQLRLVIAKAIHASQFNPDLYLSDDTEGASA